MNLYEDACLERTLDELSDQLGLLLLDLLLAGVHKARSQTHIFQEIAQAKAEAATGPEPF
ncbi:MAG: hypothetical protein AB1578_21425 [Thermodesulfobacteriota bacterium]|jgi:hypothetical protein